MSIQSFPVMTGYVRAILSRIVPKMFHIGFQYKDTTSQIKAFGVPRKRFGAPTRIV